VAAPLSVSHSGSGHKSGQAFPRPMEPSGQPDPKGPCPSGTDAGHCLLRCNRPGERRAGLVAGGAAGGG